MGYIVLLLTVGVTIYALVDCWSSGDDEVRGLPRLAWLLIVLLFPPFGGIAYLIFGRQPGHTPQLHRPRAVAPDDDPDFLRQLDQQRRRDAAQDRRDRKERDRQERRQRRTGDPDGEDHTGQPTG